MNRRAKFDAASFILGGEIRNRTNKQTKLQTVTDISNPRIDYRHVWILMQCISRHKPLLE